MKKYLYIVSGLLTFWSFQALAQLSRDDPLVDIGSTGDPESTRINEASLGKLAQEYLWGVVAIIAIAMFLWIGAKLLMAKGSEDELKNAAKSMIHIVIGLAVIPVAYFAIKFLLNLKL